MATYRKKVDVEAVRWMGTKESLVECEKLVGRDLDVSHGELVLGMYDYIPRGFYVVREHRGTGFYKVDPRAFHEIYEEVK